MYFNSLREFHPTKCPPRQKQGPPFDDPETSFDNLVNEM